MNRVFQFYFAFLILVAAASPQDVFADVTPKDDYMEESLGKDRFDKDRWEKLTDGVDYTDHMPEEKQMNLEGIDAPPKVNTNFLTVLAYILAIGLVLALILYLFKSQIFGNKSINGDATLIDLENLDEDTFRETEFEKLLRQAIEAGNFKLAIRIYYLMIIQSLTLSGWISWKKDKTNIEYLIELRSRDIYKDMQGATLTFERVWYGDMNVEEDQYDELKPKFESVLKKIPES